MFTRDAVLLVPGLFGFGAFGAPPRRISYFDRAGDLLAATLGMPRHRMVVHAQAPTAPLAVRVATLHQRVERLLAEGLRDGPVEKVHLIGHSTGGVDVRLLVNTRYLWPGGPSGAARDRFLERTGALIAMSAPHHGTPIARRLRGAAELLPAISLLSILAKRPVDIGVVDVMAALAAGARDRRGRAVAAMLARLLDQSVDTMDDILDYAMAIRRERVLIDELSPWAMERLNGMIAGGEARRVSDYVTVAPPPRPRLVVSPLEVAARALYAVAYRLSRPEPRDAAPFPAGDFIAPSEKAFALRQRGASDGVVPSASQAFTGVADAIVLGDHLDGAGHFDSNEWFGLPLFKSDAGFDDDRFERLWKHVARTVNLSRTTRAVGAARGAAEPRLEAVADPDDEFDYVVIGSGAGGGPVACNLARAGMRVLVLEAGEDTEGPVYDVPAFHPLASEHPDMNWSFFVRHYQDPVQAARDSKFVASEGGILYPRAATVGGCTAHNAMITVYPHTSDWDRIAELTQDPSWQGVRMRSYFERVESCRYLKRPRGGAADEARHGWEGWLSTYAANPRLLVGDGVLLGYLSVAVRTALFGAGGELRRMLERVRDPNDGRIAGGPVEGVYLLPIATTRNGRRVGVRERIRETQWLFPGRLTVRTGALATRVLLDDRRQARGVEYIEGTRLYRGGEAAPSAIRQVRARHEVIVAAGAFKSPQLLMLSGIGPTAELARHGIDRRVALSGVGQNLHDRYEVGVVSEMRRSFPLLRGVSFQPPVSGQPLEPAYRRWLRGEGLYTTNGVVLSIIRKSSPDLPEPDLFIFGIPGDFRGYRPGYSSEVARRKDVFTWAILKAHTRNTAGSVTLRSSDPLASPIADFRYFDEGNDGSGTNLTGVIEGVKFVRRINTAGALLVARELVPGRDVKTDDDLARFVKDEAWGHHACGTARMGPASDDSAVVDSRFRVHGTTGLRVVDASIFPRIPGFFIVSAIYMAAEKASDAILEDLAAARVDEKPLVEAVSSAA